jgi:hypothetical protein
LVAVAKSSTGTNVTAMASAGMEVTAMALVMVVEVVMAQGHQTPKSSHPHPPHW